MSSTSEAGPSASPIVPCRTPAPPQAAPGTALAIEADATVPAAPVAREGGLDNMVDGRVSALPAMEREEQWRQAEQLANDRVIERLVREVLVHQERLIEGLRRTVLEAKVIGDLLCELRARIPHGSWETWAAATFPKISDRTRQTYMRISSNWTKRLGEEVEHGRVDTIEDAMFLLRTPMKKPIDRFATKHSPGAPMIDRLTSRFHHCAKNLHEAIQEYYLENFDEIWEQVEIALERQCIAKAPPTALLVPWVVDPKVYG